jgi:hypothetical protein
MFEDREVEITKETLFKIFEYATFLNDREIYEFNGGRFLTNTYIINYTIWDSDEVIQSVKMLVPHFASMWKRVDILNCLDILKEMLETQFVEKSFITLETVYEVSKKLKKGIKSRPSRPKATLKNFI